MSVCSASSGLEGLGLADIRILVRLMCLAAAGRVHTSVDQQGVAGGGRGCGGATESSSSAFLSFLSSAIGSLVSHSPTAYRELVDICTQVCESVLVAGSICLRLFTKVGVIPFQFRK